MRRRGRMMLACQSLCGELIVSLLVLYSARRKEFPLLELWNSRSSCRSVCPRSPCRSMCKLPQSCSANSTPLLTHPIIAHLFPVIRQAKRTSWSTSTTTSYPLFAMSARSCSLSFSLSHTQFHSSLMPQSCAKLGRIHVCLLGAAGAGTLC